MGRDREHKSKATKEGFFPPRRAGGRCGGLRMTLVCAFRRDRSCTDNFTHDAAHKGETGATTASRPFIHDMRASVRRLRACIPRVKLRLPRPILCNKTAKVILSDQQGAKNPSFTAFDSGCCLRAGIPCVKLRLRRPMFCNKTTKVILSDRQGAKNPSFTAFDSGCCLRAGIPRVKSRLRRPILCNKTTKVILSDRQGAKNPSFTAVVLTRRGQRSRMPVAVGKKPRR
jgi:hypothetical protein